MYDTEERAGTTDRLHRHMTHEHVVAGLAAALKAGALTADAVALEARKAADTSAGLGARFGKRPGAAPR